jgi:hypothetical protein
LAFTADNLLFSMAEMLRRLLDEQTCLRSWLSFEFEMEILSRRH